MTETYQVPKDAQLFQTVNGHGEKVDTAPHHESPFETLDEVIIVANRKLEPQKAGGLVQAMVAFANKAEGITVTSFGWNGKKAPKGHHIQEGAQKAFEAMRTTGPIQVAEIKLSEEEVHAHYEDIANNWLWLTFHGSPELTEGEFSFANWETHKNVNQTFAKEVAAYRRAHPEQKSVIWNHDYHKTMVAKYMRDEGITDPLAFFLHIPFPKPEMLETIPQEPRHEILEGLLANDMVGFQTSKDADNFIDTIKANLYIPDECIHQTETGLEITWQGRVIRVGNYPISIDADAVAERATTPESQTKVEKLHRIFKDKQLMIDVSRLDPTKGITEELDAYDKFLTDYPEIRDDVVFLRTVSPSRESVPAYRELRERARQKVDKINKKWKQHGKKVMYIYQDVKNETVLSMIAASDVALVGTRADGMNLVAKEAAVAGPENMVVVVGKGAGASEQMAEHALIVDVTETEKLAETIYEAFSMSDQERKKRKAALNEQVHTHGVAQWAQTFMQDVLDHSEIQSVK